MREDSNVKLSLSNLNKRCREALADEANSQAIRDNKVLGRLL